MSVFKDGLRYEMYKDYSVSKSILYIWGGVKNLNIITFEREGGGLRNVEFKRAFTFLIKFNITCAFPPGINLSRKVLAVLPMYEGLHASHDIL